MKSTRVLMAALFLLSPFAANADLIFEIVRIDDSTAQITGTGTVDVAGPFNNLTFVDATSEGDTGPDGFAGDLALGGNTPNFVFTTFMTTDFSIWFTSFDMGDEITGMMIATLDVETWAAIGTSGGVFACVGNTASGCTQDGTQLGTYRIVGVPEPGTIALLGLGLIGLSMRRRSRS